MIWSTPLHIKPHLTNPTWSQISPCLTWQWPYELALQHKQIWDQTGPTSQFDERELGTIRFLWLEYLHLRSVKGLNTVEVGDWDVIHWPNLAFSLIRDKSDYAQKLHPAINSTSLFTSTLKYPWPSRHRILFARHQTEENRPKQGGTPWTCPIRNARFRFSVVKGFRTSSSCVP